MLEDPLVSSTPRGTTKNLIKTPRLGGDLGASPVCSPRLSPTISGSGVVESGLCCWPPASYRAMGGPQLREDLNIGDPLALVLVTWCLGWYGLWSLIVYGNGGPYLCAVSLATHVQIKPPLGQMIPLPDPIMIFAFAWAPAIGAIEALMALSLYSSIPTTGLSHFLWYFLASAIAFACAWRYSAGAEEVLASFRSIGLRDSELFRSLPLVPVPARLHGYLIFFHNKISGSRPGEVVEITRHHPPGLANFVEVWTSSARTPSEGRGLPVLFYVHGGAWRGGHARAHAQANLLQTMATRGWFVVSVEYRKSQWPLQLEDTEKALEWVCSDEAARLGADRNRISVSGTSAGGHIGSLLVLRSLQGKLACRPGFSSMLLFYPAIDPSDWTGVTASVPFGIPFLRYKAGESFLKWFFETFILRQRPELWPSARPLVELAQESPELIKNWPSTLVLHGDKDSVVPVAHSVNFLSVLAAGSSCQANRRPQDHLVIVPGGRHTYDLAKTRLSSACFAGACAWLENSIEK
mmetsp:Transcript_97182/g.202966  ORF Transcript_97182/g.202966 Transcript_97182/m.202966 type:complete len:521 (+) Transcript_97182:224-1786(+)